jgi:hypothetical protein
MACCGHSNEALNSIIAGNILTGSGIVSMSRRNPDVVTGSKMQITETVRTFDYLSQCQLMKKGCYRELVAH